MKRCFQLVALLAVVLLGSCTGGKDKSAAEKTEEKPKVKLADVTARPVEQIQEYTATVEAEVKNNILRHHRCVLIKSLWKWAIMCPKARN